MQYPLSDGSPFLESLIGLGLVATFAAAAGIPSVRRGYGRGVRALAAALRGTGIFADPGLSAELHRLDLLRIVLGGLVALHYWPELAAAVRAGNAEHAALFGVAVALSAALAVGLFTPLASALLLLSLNTVVSNLAFNISIGAMVVGMCLIPMIAAPAGHTLSLDAVLMRRARGRSAAAVRALYRLWGQPSVERTHIGRFLALLAFGAINLHSALTHLDSPTWRSGLTTGTILLFPTVNPNFHWVSEWVYARAPWLYVGLSLLTTWGMLVWQLLLVPLAVASRWTRLFAVLWGLAFFAVSAHVLAIKTLGVYEYVLFALVFWSSWRIGPAQRHSVRVLFDDRCNLCDKTVKAIGFVDLFRTVAFLPISANSAVAAAHGISVREAMTDLVGIEDRGRIRKGYDLYLSLAGRILLLLPLWPILGLGRWTGTGPPIYRFIADRRRALFGVCELGSHRPRSDWRPPDLPARPAISAALCLAFVLLLGAFAVRLPSVREHLGPADALSHRIFGQAPLVFGLGPIDVFNELDLRIHRSEVSLRFYGPDGEPAAHDVVLSEAANSRLTQDLRLAALSNVYCSPAFARNALSIMDRMLPADDPRRKLEAVSRFAVVSHPTPSEMLAFKYVPTTWDEICTVRGRVGAPDRVEVRYSAYTLKSLEDLFGFVPTSRQVALAARFPCDEEFPTIWSWFHMRERPAADARRYYAPVEDAWGNKSFSCAFRYSRLATYLSPAEPFRPDTGYCASETAILQAYVERVFDDRLRDLSAPAVERARAAREARQENACRDAVAEVRALYMRELFEKSAPDDMTGATAKSSVRAGDAHGAPAAAAPGRVALRSGIAGAEPPRPRPARTRGRPGPEFDGPP